MQREWSQRGRIKGGQVKGVDAEGRMLTPNPLTIGQIYRPSFRGAVK
jgi:hypothetical protein